jgi:hypothetical protein
MWRYLARSSDETSGGLCVERRSLKKSKGVLVLDGQTYRTAFTSASMTPVSQTDAAVLPRCRTASASSPELSAKNKRGSVCPRWANTPRALPSALRR